MIEDDERAREETVAAAILGHLAERPAASDTVRGVCEWWLRALDPPPTEGLVLAVLEDLERRRLVERVVNPDRTVLWKAGPASRR